MKTTKSNAVIDISNIELQGSQVIKTTVNPIYEITKKGTTILGVISILLLIISFISTFIKKYINKKEINTKLTNKKIKVLYIITGISIILSIILFIYLL